MQNEELDLLKSAKTIAVVGASDDPARPSYGVSRYLMSKGYRVLSINPKLKGSPGENTYPTLREAAKREKIDIVDVFRRPDVVPTIVDEVLELGLPALWLQEGVIHEEAAEKARKSGVRVVMDRCIAKEHRRLGL